MVCLIRCSQTIILSVWLRSQNGKPLRPPEQLKKEEIALVERAVATINRLKPAFVVFFFAIGCESLGKRSIRRFDILFDSIDIASKGRGGPPW